MYPGQAAADTFLLPTLPPNEREALVVGFCDLVTQLNAANADRPLWSLTWLSRRDQHNNGLLGALHFLRCLSQYLDNAQDGQDISVVIDNPAIAGAATRMARFRGWTVHRPWPALATWTIVSLRREIRHLTGALALVRHGLRWRRAARRHGTETAAVRDATVVLSTIFHDHTFTGTSGYRDTYFGRLPEWLAQQGEKCLVIGQVQGEPDRIAQGAAGVQSMRVECLGRYLRISDLVVAAWQAFWTRLDVRVPTPKALSFIDQTEGVIRDSLANRAVEIGLGLFAGMATRRALDTNPRARVIRMHESNPWERAVDAAAKSRPDPRHVTGYFHCAVLPAHLKNVHVPDDAPAYPKPDLVVCTGEKARDIYASMGAGAAADIVDGCDLRNVFEPVHAIERTPVKRLLVAFEGLMKMRGLLRFVYDAAPHLPHVTFVLRAHPALPLARIAPGTGVQLSERDNIVFSREPSLSSDIAGCDALLYQGSTVALTAAAMGKPLVAFEGGSLRPDDPLFACSSMKWAVATPEDLQHAIAQIEHMPSSDYQAGMRDLQGYVSAYAHRATDDTMRVFSGDRVESRPIEEVGANR